MKQSDFGNIKWFSSSTHKWKKKKSVHEKCYKFEIKDDFCMKFWYKNFKTNIPFVLNFELCIFWTDSVKTVKLSKSVTADSGRAGPGRFITDFNYLVKNKHFCSISHIKKAIAPEISRCLKDPMIVQYVICWKKLSTTRSFRFAPRRSRRAVFCGRLEERSGWAVLRVVFPAGQVLDKLPYNTLIQF